MPAMRSVAALAVAAVLLGSLATSATVHEEGGGSTTTLTKDSFDGYLDKQRRGERPCLVMFHVNWCKVCQKTFPKFAAASDVLAEKKIKMDFAHVDCTNDKTLCTRFDVKGYPTIKFFPHKEGLEPSNFRSTRSEEGFLKYTDRMTKPPVRDFEDAAALNQAMQGETFSAFVVAAVSAGAAPASFVAAAERWRDRHIFGALPSLTAALPSSVVVPAGASLAVLSSGAQQWRGADNFSEAAPAVLFYEGSLDDKEAVADWVKRHRFPGVWSLGESTFYEFTHAGRTAALVTLDPSNVSEAEELAMRGAAEKLHEHYLFGVLDGVSWAEELTDFNLRRQEIPRVLITVDDFEGWHEDIEELRMESLEGDLEAFRSGSKQLLKQGRSVVKRMQYYQREAQRMAERLYRYAQRGPREAALAAAAMAAGMAAVMTAGWCAVACCRVLLSEDGAEPWDRQQAHTKKD